MTSVEPTLAPTTAPPTATPTELPSFSSAASSMPSPTTTGVPISINTLNQRLMQQQQSTGSSAAGSFCLGGGASGGGGSGKSGGSACCGILPNLISILPQPVREIIPKPILTRIMAMRDLAIDVIPLVIAFGFSLAAYAYYVEHKLEESKRLGSKYTAACDIGIFSCTKVFSSEFGYMSQFFGLPKISNALVGMAHYFFLFCLHILTTIPQLSKKSAASGKPFWPTVFSLQTEPRGLILSLMAAIGAAGAIASCLLFYVLTVKMHDLCIVCCSIYVTNFTLLFTTVPRYLRYVRRRASGAKMGGGGGNASLNNGDGSDKWMV